MEKLENLAEQTIYFFILRLLRIDPQKILNENEIQEIAINVQKACGTANIGSIDVQEIAVNCLIRPEKFDVDSNKAESYIKKLFSDDCDEDTLSLIKSWAENVADTWKEFNSYPPDYLGQQDWDMLPPPHKIKLK
jgi:hypothetical protein